MSSSSSSIAFLCPSRKATAISRSTGLPPFSNENAGPTRRRRRRQGQGHGGVAGPLYSGYGVATNYTWEEEAYEIDVTVRVPGIVRAKDVIFRATSKSIDLKLKRGQRQQQQQEEEGKGKEEERSATATITLLDGSRPLRGRISTDGTYWVVSDPYRDGDGIEYRNVTVTVEKVIRTPRDDFDAVEYDWKGLYLSEGEGEILRREYDEPEVLDVREYAASLGVDVDNINMSMVDKTMFTSGMNTTAQRRRLKELEDSGLAREITEQSDGKQYAADVQTGEPVPFQPLGPDNEYDRLSTVTKTTNDATTKDKQTAGIPFLDTGSPWHSHKGGDDDGDEETAAEIATPAENETPPPETTSAPLSSLRPPNATTTTAASTKTTPEYVQQTRTFTRAAFARDKAIQDKRRETEEEEEEMKKSKKKKKKSKRDGTATATDPIETLTVKRLKEILKSQGMPVSGNKKELQIRLRRRVNSLLQRGNAGESGVIDDATGNSPPSAAAATTTSSSSSSSSSSSTGTAKTTDTTTTTKGRATTKFDDDDDKDAWQ